MSKKIKQISYLSAIIISIGSSIGAGIFFKNGEIFKNAGGSLSFMIASWIVAAIGIMAIGLALVEVSSGSKSDGGIIEWVKKFAPKKVGKYSASYMLLVFLPLNYLAMPIYAVMSLQDALQSADGTQAFTGWEVAMIGFAFFLWLAIMAYLKIKVSEKLQWLFTALKFLPLIIIPILAAIQTGQAGGITDYSGDPVDGLTAFSPWLGLMASIPAILFAVDGFYTVTALKSELKHEKKLGSVIAVAISIMMGAYLIYAILLGTAGAGSQFDINIISSHSWLGICVNLCIVMAVLGIVNGFAMAVPNMYTTMADEGDANFVLSFKNKFGFKETKDAAFFISIIITVAMYIVLVPIGIYCWNGTSYDFYGQSAGNLYEMMDLITNFTSLFVFIFIATAIIGAIKNRKTKKVEVDKKAYFLPVAWFAVIFIIIGAAYMLISSMVNMSGINDADVTTSVIKFCVLIFTALLALVPVWNKQEWSNGFMKIKGVFSKK